MSTSNLRQSFYTFEHLNADLIKIFLDYCFLVDGISSNTSFTFLTNS